LAIAAGASAQTLVAAQHDRETLMRTRGQLIGYMDAAGAPSRYVSVAVGFALVPEGTGTTVLWSPATDADAPWFYYSIFQLGHEEMVVDVIAVQELLAYRETIDSKAMRRVRNQEVQMVVENVTLNGAGSVNVTASGRFLSQE